MDSYDAIFPELSGYNLIDDNIKIASLTFGIELFTDQSFYKYPKSVIYAWDKFLEIVPSQRLSYYATETMKIHKPVTARVLSMVKTWLSPDAPKKEFLALEVKAADDYRSAPDVKWEIWSEVDFSEANVLSIALPAEWGLTRTDDLLSLVMDISNNFPFLSGLAGFSYECSRYAKEDSETFAWQKSMRHTGIDIVRLPFDSKVGVTGALKGIGWLTLLGDQALSKLGGLHEVRRKLPNEIEIIDLRDGVAIKIGNLPSLGDINRGEVLPLYRAVYKVLAPMIRVASERSMSFNLEDDFVEKTEMWFARQGA